MRFLGPLWLASAVASGALAFANVEVGGKLPNPEMTLLEGSKRNFLAGRATSLFVFFDPAQEHSRELLRELAELQAEHPAGDVEWVGLVSERTSREQVEAAISQAGVRLTIMVDAGDRLYGELGVRLYPSVGIADADHMLRAYLPYEKINYRAVLLAHLQRALGEIDEKQLQEALRPAPVQINGEAAQAERNLKLVGMLLDAGKLDAALAAARRAITQFPALAEVHAFEGAILVARGECPAAHESLQRALELDPANTRAKEALARCP